MKPEVAAAFSTLESVVRQESDCAGSLSCATCARAGVQLPECVARDRIRAALKAAPDPEEVALLRAVRSEAEPLSCYSPALRAALHDLAAWQDGA